MATYVGEHIGTVSSVTFTPTTGALLIAYCASNGGTVSAPTDGKNTWLQLDTERVTGSYRGRVYYVESAAAGSTTVTFHNDNLADSVVWEWTGLAQSGTLRNGAGTSGSGNPWSVGPIDANIGDLLFGVIVSMSQIPTNPDGWTSRSTWNGNLMSDMAVSSSASYSYGSASGGGSGFVAFIGAFKPPVSMTQEGFRFRNDDGIQ